jgi:hypothetical protein
MNSVEDDEGQDRPVREIALDEDLLQGMRVDVNEQFDRSVEIKDIRTVAETVEMKVIVCKQGLRDIFSEFHKENDLKKKTLENLLTVRDARQLAGEIFIMVSDLGVEVVEDEDLIKMRLQLQADAAEQENKMIELEKEMIEEENRASIRENKLFYLTADINLRKQLCNEMEAESRRMENEKTEVMSVFRSYDMNGV